MHILKRLYDFCRAALTNMQSVKRFIAKAMIEEVRVSAGGLAPTNRQALPLPRLSLPPNQYYIYYFTSYLLHIEGHQRVRKLQHEWNI